MAYYFVYVPPEKERNFLAALESKEITDLTDWGEVIASCYDEQPDDEVKRFLKDRYGFDV